MPGEESDLFGWMLFRGLGVLAGLIVAVGGVAAYLAIRGG